MAEQSTTAMTPGNRGELIAQTIALATAGLGSAALLASMARLSAGEAPIIAWLAYGAWGLLPFLLTVAVLTRRRPGVWRSILFTCISAFALVMYGDLLFATRLSSTAGLAFLFIPLWQLLGCVVILALIWLFSWGGRRG